MIKIRNMKKNIFIVFLHFAYLGTFCALDLMNTLYYILSNTNEFHIFSKLKNFLNVGFN